MSQKTNRRSFLSLLAAAPAASQLAAKEAAMGLSNISTSGFGEASSFGATGLQEVAVPKPASWSLSEAVSYFVKAKRSNYENHRIKIEARVLDPDVASLRSVSLAQMYAIQLKRIEDRHERERREEFVTSVFYQFGVSKETVEQMIEAAR